jgi:hypothetical protein
VHWEFKTSAEIHTGYNFTRAGVLTPFEIVPGVEIPADTYDHGEMALNYYSDTSKPFSFSLRTVVGGQFGGDRVSLSPTLNYRIGETFRSELSFNYNDYDLPYEGGQFTASLARLRLSYSFTPKIQLQALVQYNDTSEKVGTNIRFSWVRTANSGLYLVYNEVDERAVGGLPNGREIILKYSYIFDVFS